MATQRTPPLTRNRNQQLQQSAAKSSTDNFQEKIIKTRNQKKNLSKIPKIVSNKVSVSQDTEVIIEEKEIVTSSVPKSNRKNQNLRLNIDSVPCSNNIYDNLSNDADGPENFDHISTHTSLHKIKKKPYTPIILTRKLKSLKDTIKKIKGWSTNVIHFRSVNDGISIITYSKTDYDTVIFKFKQLEFEFYTFTPMDLRTKKLVIKGISPIYEISDILEDLNLQTDGKNINVLSISNLTRHLKNKENNTLHRTPSNKFLVYFSSDSDINYITNNIIHVCDHKISWEPYIKKFFATQCRRCQRYGHAASNCNQRFRCVKCTSIHAPGECKKLFEDKPRCINCNGEHSANYKKCITFINYTEKNENQRTTYQKSTGFSSPIVNQKISFRTALISNSNLTEQDPLANEGEESNDFLFMLNEINSLFNTSIEELMNKIKAFMPTYNNSTDQSSKKCLMIGFLSQFV